MGKAENTITGIYGMKGGGKTLIMTLFLIMEWEMMMRPSVFTNYEIYVVDSEYLKGHDMAELNMKLANSIIGIDELHGYADSRKSGSLQNRRVASFFLQSRHTNSNIYYTTQFKDQVDKRIRRITDIDVVVENMYVDSDGDGNDDLFHFVVTDHRRNTSIHKTICASPLFDTYDSTERINPFEWNKKDEKGLLV